MQINKIFAIIAFAFVLLNLEGILWKSRWVEKHEKMIRLVAAVVMLCFGLYYLFQ
ncbi:hypothetical protein [Aedoeadaptatus acetigenes]|uniref:hypothetical protein n=1 Tax=Aedoeadaptatus acetigenes TaxID=2981723 RepID=UPI002265848F|nr:hypothetical protein [Aedoeadaptatus acetigenes]MCU6787098.1 hypothetical protein [Aedoeadaptatus acetigenes]